ncbi:1-(5-phosphoribosyl)-5-[(5-phosphoribosylamino)methylideneamino]imidazole-4-carboxamide isomerase [Listeria newyorkensis]|uniref:1-(5-phosphoribosyl)-5-[(5-phosphoribosylamino)methylideneamino] imidazole-4-carboxamide isomerase n=1 Tax=Listeria newyorkensis TaxID=1497681 RepID=A0ABX4XLQ1_9LIST|nr:1-(5-phosphoribosyl)-5-[(5-phosphoribosylamino)methylideneamino]imidazole-4-carboxamide isomerase [Listeria newyorkensis]KGL37462.1 1-(5-phosphoribosyl)-5-[(5-phosphoribosylamino)methylideneamino] imidazole-4-carboxamide isomerase [Listeria newyorkensis]KMT61988.1 1-(5-phosphoribosyl)-5-[(5- phosphoribosylamino)methylideneamino] imidazole-4-carboxamide isomerase [Listeria newyorkensis]PNP92119.1 1-(5-phosphoribosyl)-5-[(5-phosphoribosylamino)methylideneamino]imidazole-4-carboxamide isomerase 
MRIFPAIDLKNGRCVRLYQGDFAQETVVNPDPIAQAATFSEQGATYLHIVDLDGALEGKPINLDVIRAMKKAAGLPVQVGGGIRTMKQITFYLEEAGIDRVIIGSAALENPDLVRDAVKLYGAKIAVGIDAKNGFVATSGWLDVSATDYLTFAKEVEKSGVQTIIFTDIAKDGTLEGPNLEQLQALQRAVSVDIIASGGVSSKQDLEQLSELGLYGAICGKALYNGNISMAEITEVENLAD